VCPAHTVLLQSKAPAAILSAMQIRDARIPDVEAICSLITSHAELDKMLFRSKADIYENLQSFLVAEIDGRILGCCVLQVVWAELGEIKSLAVDENFTGRGIGGKLVTAAVEKARHLGLAKLFTLTLEQPFFEKSGFEKVDKDTLPMKVWTDCAKCPKQDNCDEIALLLKL